MAGSGSGPDGGAGDGAGDRRGDGRRAERAAAPLLTVVRGDASAEDIAALTAVLAAKSAVARATASAASVASAPRGGRAFGWASRQAMLRKPLAHGPGAWRASARPGA